MKNKIIAIMLSVGVSASLLMGCGVADKLKSGSAGESSDTAVSENSDSKLDDIKQEDSAADLLMENEDAAAQNENLEADQADGENADNHVEDSSEKDSSETESSVEENSETVAISHRHPTFKIAEKKYSKRYEGDAKFDESNENSKDYSNGVLYEATYQYLLMDDECKDDYPLLYEAINKASDEGMAKSDKQAENIANEAKGMYEEAAKEGSSFFGPYSLEEEITVKRADETVLSVYNFESDYEGGAHGMYGASCDNYDVTTAAELKLSDVVAISEDELNEIIKKELLEIEEYEGQFTDLDSKLSSYKYDPKPDYENNVYEFGYMWYLSHDGLHIFFNPYDLASYADGMQDIVIGYNEYPGTINDKYIPEDNTAYCVKHRYNFISEEFDTDNEYTHFRYSASKQEGAEEYLVADSFELVKDGKVAKVDTGFWVKDAYSFETYDVGTEDGREYIYLFIPVESDYINLVVFDVSNGDVKLAGSDTYHYMESYNEYWFDLEPALTNPHDMHFCKTDDSFGTYTYYGSYEVGDDGLPRYTGDRYTLAWKSEEAYSKVDIKADVIDEEGNIIEKDVTIPKGEHFVPMYTDAESYMDFKLDDGRMIRLTYSSFDNPASIPEGEVGELFDELVYAG